MWDDVIIGKGPHICSAVKCYEGPDTKVHISENQNSYWISDLILGGGMKIFKDTVPGKKLTEMLNKQPIDMIGEKKISKFLNKLFLARCNSERLMEIIEVKMEEAYDNGKEMKAEEIRRALGIYNY
jgi:hypothetical protein